METYNILHALTNNIIFSAEANSLKSCIQQAVAVGTDLRFAFFENTNLVETMFCEAKAYGAYFLRTDLEASSFRNADFEAASFLWSNLKSTNLEKANLRGAFFSGSNLKNAYLQGANLEGARFENARLQGAIFENTNLDNADFHAADLEGAKLEGARLRGADFNKSNLRGVDILSADIIPAIPHIDRAIIKAITNDNGKLNMSFYHDELCDTTHCRAGWAVHLAGGPGYALERKIGPAAAGALIYAKSRPNKPCPDFYEETDEAFLDIKKCAE